MRILYVANIRLPTEMAHGVQIVKTCEALADQGVAVELIVPGRKNPTITDDTFSFYGIRKNFTLTSLPLPDFIKWEPIGFMLNALLFSEAVKLHPSFFKADIVYSRDASVLLQYVLLGRRLVYEAHTAPTFISRLVARIAHRVVVISKGLADEYRALGVNPEKLIIAPDAVDLAPYALPYRQDEARRTLGLPTDSKMALYVGKINAMKGADTFAASKEHLKEGIEVALVGDGPLLVSLKETHPKVRYTPETPHRELPKVLVAADVLVIPNSNRDADSSRYTSPIKLFAYMASGIPIVASDVPALREVLDDKNAFFFKPDDAESLARTIEAILADPKESAVRAERAKREVARYTWRARAEAIRAGV